MDDRKSPKRQPGPGDTPQPNVGSGDKSPQGSRPQGSAWPNKKHLQSPGMVKVLQAKMDQSAGLDKGSCVACLLGGGVGCPVDNRVGCEGRCGHSHQGPGDRKVPFCKDVAKNLRLRCASLLQQPEVLDLGAVGAPAACRAGGGQKQARRRLAEARVERVGRRRRRRRRR